MMKVALTGNVASGKSTLARIWAGEGVPLISADELAREAVAPGTAGLQAVKTLLGPEILKEDGTLDRDRARAMVFRDVFLRKELEGILHPIIRDLRDDRMEQVARGGSSLVVAEIPLLFEAGLEEDYDVVVLVHTEYQERLRRLTRIRGLGEEEARRILDSQIPSEEKLHLVSYVIRNDGSEEDLAVRALALLDLLRARAARKGVS
jgi:dephospho-CoA kinase